MPVDAVFEFLPPRGLDQSILLAVLFGMLLLLFLTESFGWVFVGLVVPGYLSSVAIIQPSSAFAVVFESVLTYLLSYSVSEFLSRSRSWSPFFGRERFLLIVLVSIFVRQNSQIWLLPAVLRQIDAQFGTTWYTDLDFYSIGLVLIPLTANMFWKLGLVRGGLQVAVPTLITYAVLRLVMLPYTNLSFASLALTYENVALDFLGSPKAYVILLVGAFLAAQANLRYGWDYSGVLVPSLLALAWFTPLVVVVTLGEAVILFLVTRTALLLPLVRTLNLEGPRKVSLVFVIGFLLKYAGGWSLYYWLPDVRVTDFFGFGYVLTSLLAVKMLTKRVVGRVLLPTALISALAFVVGSLVGYVLEQLAPSDKAQVALAERDRVTTRMLTREPLGVMALAEVRARSVLPEGMEEGRDGHTLRDYASLWRGIDRWLAGGGGAIALEREAAELGLWLRPLERGFTPDEPAYALFEREERLAQQTGWDTAVLVPGAPGPYIEVPAPESERPVAQVAPALCAALRCRGVLVSGTDGQGTDAANPLAHPRSSFHVAHRQLGAAAVIQLRADPALPVGRPVLHLQHTLPPDIHLDELWPGELELRWTAPPAPLQQWRTGSDIAILRVHPDDLRARLREAAPALPPALPDTDLERFAAPLVESAPAPTQAPRDPERWRVVLPSESELRFLERTLASGLLAAPPPDTAADHPVRWLQRMAALVDHQIAHLPDCAGPGRGCWMLAPQDPEQPFPLGLLAVRTEPAEPLAIEIPRPQRERGTFRVGATLWRDADAQAILINPDEKLIGPGMRLDPTIIGNPVTPFQAVHQALHHSLVDDGPSRPVDEAPARVAPDPDELDGPIPDAVVGVAGGDGPDPAAPVAARSEVATPSGLIVQVRGFAGWRAINEDLVIGMGPPVMQRWQIPLRLQALIAPEGPLGWLGDSLRFADGSEEFIALAGQGTPQLSYSRSLGGVDIALLWLSESARERYRPASRERYREQFQRAGLTLRDRPFAEALQAPSLTPSRGPLAGPARAEFERLLEFGRHYAVTRDIHVLRALGREAQSSPAVTLEALWSHELGLPLLRLELVDAGETRRALLLASLPPGLEDRACEGEPVLGPDADADAARPLVLRCGFAIVAGGGPR